MTTEEAIEAMEAVGHDFYMFRDGQTKGIQVGVVVAAVDTWMLRRYGVLVLDSGLPHQTCCAFCDRYAC